MLNLKMSNNDQLFLPQGQRQTKIAMLHQVFKQASASATFTSKTEHSKQFDLSTSFLYQYQVSPTQ